MIKLGALEFLIVQKKRSEIMKNNDFTI